MRTKQLWKLKSASPARIIIGCDKKGALVFVFEPAWKEKSEEERLTIPFEEPERYPFIFQIYFLLTGQGLSALGKTSRRINEKAQVGPGPTPLESDPQARGSKDLPPIQEDEADIKINPKNTHVIKPHSDLKDLPAKLSKASPEERERLLMGMHERFWHCGPETWLDCYRLHLFPGTLFLKA